MKYSEAKKQIEALSSLYNIDMEDGDFNVKYELVMDDFAFVEGSEQYQVDFYSDDALSKIPSKDKLYMILVELATTPPDERAEDKKYFIRVFKSCDGYLNFYDGKPELNDASDGDEYKVKFTDKEIEQLKQRQDIPLDWNKVELEPVNEY